MEREDHDQDVPRRAKALGDPTRHAIFRAIADSDKPVDVAGLTARFGLNHNAIRQHLSKLCAAGLVVEEVGPRSGPGRPRLQYRPSLAVNADWGIPSPYEHLAVMLVEALSSGRSPREVGAEAGRRMAAQLPASDDPVDRIELNAVRLGFEPRRVERRSTVDLVLCRCPYQAPAKAAPDIVCQLHLGLAEGMAEAGGDGLSVTGLVARDPRRAGCRLTLTRNAEPEAPKRVPRRRWADSRWDASNPGCPTGSVTLSSAVQVRHLQRCTVQALGGAALRRAVVSITSTLPRRNGQWPSPPAPRPSLLSA